MTDSASWRRRRRGGRHQQPIRRDPSHPLPPDVARQNRENAFGTSRRTWVDTPASGAPEEEPVPEETSADLPGPADAPRDDTPTAHGPHGEGQDLAPDPAEPPAPAAPAAPAAPQASASDTARTAGPAPQDPSSPAPSAAPATPSRRTGHGRRAARPVAPVPAEETQTDLWASSAPPAEEPGPAAASPAPARPAEEPTPAPAAAARAATAPEEPIRSTASSSAAAAAEEPARAAREPLAERPREESRPRGALGKVIAWTVGTTVVPGLGLVTTRMRMLGWALIGLLVLSGAGVAAFLLLGDPLRTGVKLVTHRWILITALVIAVVVALVWIGQILLTALAHSTEQRLERRRRLFALAVAAVMVLVVALPFGRGVQSLWATQGLLGSDSVFSRSGSSTLADGKDPWAGAGRINILMLGQDAGQDRTGTRPDTIMVASVDSATGKTALFSIPRNLEKVRFPEGTVAAKEFPDGFDYYGKNQDLINAVWTWAEEHEDLFPGDPEPGLTATRWAVEETLGLKTDYYAMVNLQGFEDMVNAIGGVDMVVERRIPIGGGTNQATGGKYPITGYIEPGQQHLDGYHALWYARSREGSNDFNRMCRQQRMVRVVVEESDPATLAMSIPGLVTATENNIVTDIPTSDIDAFAELGLRIKDSGFKSYPITQDVTKSYDPDWDYLKKWVQASIDDSMASTGAQSVTGETKAGSTEPAETGAAPEQESESSAESTEEETTTEEPSESASEDASGDETSTATPTIEQDPLKSCLPGAEEAG